MTYDMGGGIVLEAAEKVDAQLQRPTNHVPLKLEETSSLDSAVTG